MDPTNHEGDIVCERPLTILHYVSRSVKTGEGIQENVREEGLQE